MESNRNTTEPAAPNEESSNSSSLTLSISPPLSDKDDEKDETSTISEHLSSVENDRSMQEVEVNFPENFTLLLEDLPDERISQEPKPPSLNSSFNNSSIISLNGLERLVNMEGGNYAKSILEEILNNDQFKSDNESKEESLDIFANLDLDDKLLNSYNHGKSANFNLSLKNDSFNSYDEVCKRVKDFEELIAVKDTTIAALTSELDSYRELISNTSSLGTSTTEYKQYQEECHNKLVEYHNAITHKDEQIEKLANSLQQSILSKEEMKQQFKNEISQLQEELEKTSALLKEHKCQIQLRSDFDEVCSKLAQELSPNQLNLLNDLKMALDKHVEEKRREVEHEIEKIECDKRQFEAENARLKELLDSKHSKEMEELRTYFEKKCADLEKNYSEEVFSQHSRKMSGSSSCSEMELSSDFPGPGGDAVVKLDYTKKDLVKLRQTLNHLVKLLDGHDDLHQLSDDDFTRLKDEIGKSDLKNLLKYDLAAVQNKYHAELEILREDFDNRLDIINVEHENKLKSMEKRYREEIEDLNSQLQGRIVTTAQQEVANSGDFEIDEVVQSYERRLQEQVTLAKIDIIGALETQIQRLASGDAANEDWPEELLKLKARFSEKYEKEIELLKAEHADEVARLKEEHVKSLNGALERARRRSLRDSDSLNRGELELVRERDALKKQTLALRNLLGELLKYFTQCEDELNNTLVEELINKNITTRLEEELEESSSSRESVGKRVHLLPNFSDLLNLIDNNGSENDLEAIDLKSELGSCLEKLKSDANAILALTSNFNREEKETSVVPEKNLERELSSLTRRLISETQVKNSLLEQLNEAKSVVQSLETERGNLESQLELVLDRQKVLEGDLVKAREKIAELIESGHKEIVSEGYGEDGHKAVRGLVEATTVLSELQEKARCLAENRGSLDGNVVHLIEELARIGGKIVEEAKKEKDDLKQQVENLEQQLRDMSRALEASERRFKEADGERAEAVDKIFELRDIIRELEEQVRAKNDSEEQLKGIVGELEALVKCNHHSEEDSDRQRPAELHRYVEELEKEVQKLRVSSELVGNEGVVQQIRNQLCEFENTLEKRTKDLEGFASTVSTTTCSSPSEDMSIRDVVNNKNAVYDECEVPLQQLARLKEKLQRHSRAEDAAVKRIRDLEMQLLSLKNDLDEAQAERDMLKKQNSDHLVLISNLQIRLDEQRIRAEHIEKQTNTSLEVQNYDLKNTIASLEEKIAKRDKTISQLKTSVEETKRRLDDREIEMAENKKDEEALIVRMQEQLEVLRAENLKLKQQATKNSVADNVSGEVLELFASLGLDKSDVEVLNKLKLSGVSFRELMDLEEVEQVRRAKNQSDSLIASPEVLALRKKKNETLLEPEVGFFSLQHPKANSTEKHVRFEDEESKFLQLQQEVDEKNAVIKDLESRLSKLKDLEARVEELQRALETTEDSLRRTTERFEEEQRRNDEETARIRENLSVKEEEVKACRVELEEERERVQALEKELKSAQRSKSELKNVLKTKEMELESHEQALKLQNEEVKKLQEESNATKLLQKESKDKDVKLAQMKIQVEDLSKELVHLQHLLAEKEKVIDQMGADSRSLHVNLETIQSKLQETGNVVDLGRRLREEQKKNSALHDELHALKAQLLSVGDRRSIEDIAGQVQRELDYSAYLDATLINAAAVGGGGDQSDGEDVKLALKKQKSLNKQLVKAKEVAERRCEQLEKKFEELRKELDRVQFEDAALIEQLRTKLDRAVDMEATRKLKMSSLLEYGGGERRVERLEEENGALRKELKAKEGELRVREAALEVRDEELRKLEAAVKEKAKLKAELEVKNGEVAAMKNLMDDMEADRRRLTRQLEGQKTKMSDTLPDRLMEKIRELNDVVRDNMKMVDLISRLTHEKTVLEERIAFLEDHRVHIPFDDPVSRANYLFAKYLRSESYRKALAWQKRYLISLLETYQLAPIYPEVESETSRRKPKRSSGRRRFKSVAIMIVAVCRMKYLVRRWHSGKRIAQQRTVQQQQQHQQQRAQFQVGQPVDSQNFAPPKSALSQSSKSDMPWFGTSPPSKEVPKKPPERRFEEMPSRPLHQDTPMQAPAMLSKYIDRFNQIQERLGLDSYH